MIGVFRTLSLGAATLLSSVLAVSPAIAATPVFVDTSGVCAGRTPCFTTIQAGLNNAGPAPAIVNVFPGTYVESADIGLMGSAIAGSPGSVTLRTVNSAGTPTPGTVNVLPTTGPAFTSSVAPYPGDVELDGFRVQSSDDDGINLGMMQGSVTMRDIISDGNAERGFSSGTNGQDVRVYHSSFSDNLGGDGLNFGQAVDVTFEHVTADGNNGDGASFGVDGTGTVRVTDSSFSDNTDGSGLSFSTAKNVILQNVTADRNNGSGASFGISGGTMFATNSSFSDNTDGSGLSFASALDVTLQNVTADRNSGSGASFGMNGIMLATNSSFSDNTNGTGLTFSTATDVTLQNVAADRNGVSGASFGINGGTMLAINSSFDDNTGGSGISFGSALDVTFRNVTADRNNGFGASFGINNGTMTATNSSFSGNTDGAGLQFGTANRIQLTQVTVSNNSADGLSTNTRKATISGSRFENNGGNGVALNAPPDAGSLVLACNDIAGNGDGLKSGATTVIRALQNFWGDPSGPTHPSNPTGTGDTIVDGANGGSGTVEFVPFLEAPASEIGTCQPQPAPVLDMTSIALLALALFLLPVWRLRSRGTLG